MVHSFYTSENPSGENQAVLDQFAVLEAAGHDVVLINRKTDEDSQQPLYKVRSAFRAANVGGPDPSPELEKFRPDIVHVHNLFPNWGTGWLKKWTHNSVATLHNFRTLCAAGWLYRDGHVCHECLDKSSLAAIRHKCYKDSPIASLPLAIATRDRGKYAATLQYPTRLIAHTDPSVALFESLVGPKVDKVPYFVSDTPVTRSDRTSGSWVFIGRLGTEKGIDWLIENWPREQRLTIIGSGGLESMVREAAAKEPNTFDYVGQLPYAEARSLIAGSKGVVVSSRWPETGPLTAIEALQSGTPLAVSDSIAQANELTKNGAGVQFNIEAGAASLRAALERLDEGAVSRSNARARFEEEFSAKVWLSRVEQTYAKVLNPKEFA